jgi:O-antigen/teichoic acid export membrane protein
VSKQRIISNLLVMATGQIATWALSTVYLVLVSRYLGPGRQGELSLATSVVAVFGLILALGMDTFITRAVARAPERTGTLASTAMMVRGAVAIPVLAALYIYAHVAHLNAETRQATYIMAVSALVGALGGVLLAAFQGHEQMSRLTIGVVVQNVLDLALAILVIRLHGSVLAFAAIPVLVTLTLLALNLYWVRRIARLTWHVSLWDVREVVRGSLAFWANSVFLTIYIYIDSVILFSLAGARAVGFYAPATRMFSVALFLPTIIGAVTLPQLSRLGVEAGSDFTRASRKTLSFLIACAVPATIGLATFAGPLVHIVFGPAYQPAAPALLILSLCIPFTFVNIQFAQMLAARDQQWRWTVIMAVSCVVNPLLNVAAIPLAERLWHNGAMGAASALLVTEIVMAVYGVVILRDVLRDRTLHRSVVGATVAGAGQAAVLWLTASLWPMVGESLGIVAYGTIALALGVVSRDDVGLLVGTVTRRRRLTPSRSPSL